MTGYCIQGDHANCHDPENCTCPCHLVEDAVDTIINTSAEFGHAFMAKVEYADGGTTWHGPFPAEDKAWEWLDARLELDYEDIAEGYEGEVVPLNLVNDEQALTLAEETPERALTAWRKVTKDLLDRLPKSPAYFEQALSVTTDPGDLLGPIDLGAYRAGREDDQDDVLGTPPASHPVWRSARLTEKDEIDEAVDEALEKGQPALRVAASYQLMSDEDGRELMPLILGDAVEAGHIRAFNVTGCYRGVWGLQLVTFDVDIAFDGERFRKEMTYDEAKEAASNLLNGTVIHDSDVEVSWVSPIGGN